MVYEGAGGAAVDEVEVLFDLLKAIRDDEAAAGRPVGGVCSGAILSSYQRLRVEHVCARLGLLSYAYLWQRTAGDVLSLAAQLRVEARLIKVASMGLAPRRHLGKTLVELAPYLMGLEPHVHPAGEGGEFETFVFDAPMAAGTRLVFDGEARAVIVDANDISPVGQLDFAVATVSKTAEEVAADAAVRPELLQSSDFRRTLAAMPHNYDDDLARFAAKGDAVEVSSAELAAAATAMVPTWASIDDVCAAVPPLVVTPGLMPLAAVRNCPSTPGAHGVEVRHGCRGAASDDVPAQIRSILAGLTAAERRRVCYTFVFLPSMGSFLAVNAVYTDFFGVSPPARAVVEVSTLAGAVMDIVLSADDSQRREVLHVQSISNWAAACIGPYAQANRVLPDGCLATAGMLGLEPGTMTLAGLAGCSLGAVASHDDIFVRQFSLCYRNLRAVLRNLKSGVARLTHLVIFVVDAADANKLSRLWRWAAHHYGDGPDAVMPERTRVLRVSALPKGAVFEMIGCDWARRPVRDEFDDSDDEADGDIDAVVAAANDACPFWNRDYV
jgi:diphthine-ammonia ligase